MSRIVRSWTSQSSQTSSTRSIQRTPCRTLGPLTHCVLCPGRRLVFVASRARIGNGVLVRHFWRDEAESVGVHERPRNAFGFDCRHMASDALASDAALFVVGMLGEDRCAGAVRACRAVTVEAYLVGGLSQLSVVGGAVDIMARGAG